MKTCTNCKEDFPKNKDYFFVKKTKQKLASGKIAIYFSFKSICKKCHGKKGNDLRVKKRCVELNCDVLDYRKNWKQQYTNTRMHHPEITGLSKGRRTVVLKKIKNGYIYKGEEQYKKDCLFNISMAARKHDYGNIMPTAKQKQKVNNNKKRDTLSEAYIGQMLGYKVGEGSTEVIETKRLLIKIYRELKKQQL
jgi:hypothetical protein